MKSKKPTKPKTQNTKFTYKQLITGLLIICLIVLLVPLVSFLKVRMQDDDWQCKSAKHAGQTCQDYKTQLKREGAKAQDVSYKNTNIKAYLPTYLPAGYRVEDSDLTYADGKYKSVHATFRYNLKLDKNAYLYTFSFLSANDNQDVEAKIFDAPVARVGTTKSGETVSKYLTRESADEDVSIWYVIKRQDTYLIVVGSEDISRKITAEEAIKMFDSVKRVN